MNARTKPALALGAAALALGLAASAAWPDRARAHGGEDHSAPAGASGKRSAPMDENHARVPIETQFLLGLRTARAATGALAEGTGQLGRTLPLPSREQRVITPFAGRFKPGPGGFPRLGQEVKRGDPLGTLLPTLGGAERTDLRLAQTDAAARLAQTKARLELAKAEAARLRGLRGVVAEREIQAAEAEVVVLGAELDRAKTDASGLSGGPQSERLVATLDGTIVAAHSAPTGQLAEGAELVRIVDLDKLWVELWIPEADARAGLGARASMSLAADPSVRFEGAQVAVASLVDPATRTVQALYEVDNASLGLRVGELVSVAVSTGAPIPAIVVPEQALVERGGQPAVLVKTAPELFEVRPVSITSRSAGRVGLGAGVRAGERVVVDGATAVLLAAGG